MTDNTQSDALDLAGWLDGCGGLTSKSAAAELRRLHALTTQQQRDLIAESHRTAEQKLRADQMTTQHAHQAALNTEARAQLAAALTAQAISAEQAGACAAELRRLHAELETLPVGYINRGIAPHTKGRTVFHEKPTRNLEERWWSRDEPVFLASHGQAPAGASHEQALEEALRERDEADDFIDTLLDEVLGADRAEWSSAYGRADALEEVRERIAALHKPAVERAWKQFEAATKQPSEAVAYLDVGAGGYLDLDAALSDEAMQQLPKGRHALVIAGAYGIDGYVAAPQPSPGAQADSVCYDYAKQIAESMWATHYKADAPHWESCDSLMGVLSQISNMMCGLSRAPADSVTAPAATPTAASIAWTALRDLTDPLGEAGVKIMGHVRIYAQLQYEAGRTEGRATPPAQAQAGAVPLTDEQIQDLLLCGDPTDEEMRLIRIGWDAAHGIKGGQHVE